MVVRKRSCSHRARDAAVDVRVEAADVATFLVVLLQDPRVGVVVEGLHEHVARGAGPAAVLGGGVQAGRVEHHQAARLGVQLDACGRVDAEVLRPRVDLDT